MALSVLRGQTPVRSSTAHLTRIPLEDDKSYIEFHQDGDYFTTHYIPNSKSMLNPPTHLHLYQTEDFKVIEGKGIWYLPTRNQQHTMVAGDPPNHLPAGVFHRFQNPSETEPLKVMFRIDPDNNKVNRKTEERFFRNFFCYLDDCQKQKISPSIFQLELFLWTVDGPLAIPIPGPDSLKWWTSWLFCVVLGVLIGEMCLGYKRTYQEYFTDGKKED